MRVHEIITERQALLDNPAFRAWFGRSVVVDDQGQPLRVYHGTAEDIGEFRTDGIGSGSREGALGSWFTENPEAASGFADFARPRNYGQTGANVLPVYLRIERPWVVTRYDDIRDLIDKFTEFERPGMKVSGRQIRMMRDKVDHRAAVEHLKAQGYDGIILPNTLTDSPDGQTPITQYVVFDPGQVKSAVGNRGSFDAESPLIHEAAVTAARASVPQDRWDGFLAAMSRWATYDYNPAEPGAKTEVENGLLAFEDVAAKFRRRSGEFLYRGLSLPDKTLKALSRTRTLALDGSRHALSSWSREVYNCHKFANKADGGIIMRFPTRSLNVFLSCEQVWRSMTPAEQSKHHLIEFTVQETEVIVRHPPKLVVTEDNIWEFVDGEEEW